MRLKGKHIALFDTSGGTPQPIALAVTCALDVQVEVKESSNALDGGAAKSFVPGRYEWTMSTEHLVELPDTGTSQVRSLLDAELARTLLTVTISRCQVTDGALAEVAGLTLTGTAYITSLHLEGSVDGMARYSAQMRGTGVLS